MSHALPTTLYSVQQIRTLEQQTILSGLSDFNLMSRAGEAAFSTLRHHWPQAKKIAIFCGSGNNAGDGYILAHRLVSAGLTVQVYALSDPEQLPSTALRAYHAFLVVQGRVQSFNPSIPVTAEVLVDALFGIGLTRAITGSYQIVVDYLNCSAKPILAIDIPSGIHADTGAVLGCAVRAACTITFIGLKIGLLTGAALDYVGKLELASLALPAQLYANNPPLVTRITHQPLAKRSRCAHKGLYGHVLIIGGNCGFSGAVLLAARAALRVGSGLVSIATRPEHAAGLNVMCPEIMCHGVTEANELLPLLAKASVIVIGPGLGQNTWAHDLLAATVNTSQPIIIDADALNLLAQQPERYQHSAWVLTPHPGEAARLLHVRSADIQQDRLAAIQTLQARYGGIVVLKGAGTLIAAANNLSLVTTGNPGMASGGMGDVLTGVIAGLYAQGMPLLSAVQQGVYVHGAAADIAVRIEGERGLLASDLLPHLRHWVNRP